jgi:hypothetical protein
MVESTEVSVIRESESIRLPLLALRAALTCTQDDGGRYYLEGVYVHAVDSDYRVVGTDGHRMFVYSVPIPRKEVDQQPAWLEKGVIIPREGLKERLALFAKLKSSVVSLSYQIDAPWLSLADPLDQCTFKLQPVNGTFPAYQRSFDTLKVFEARAGGEEMTSVAYDASYLKGVGDLAKLLEADTVRVFGGGNSVDAEDKAITDPTLIVFPEAPQAVLILMPKTTSQQLGFGAARVLSGAVAGSVAALRAHRTRWQNVIDDPQSSARAKKDAAAKVADYDRRIEAIAANAERPALPPPPDPWEVFHDAVVDGLKAIDREDALEETPEWEIRAWFRQELSPEDVIAKMTAPVSYAISGVLLPPPAQPDPEPEVEAEAKPEGVTDLADYRRKLKAAARKKAFTRFCADINAALEGETLNQFDVPIADWFEEGLTPDEAASRCLTSRQPPEGDTEAEIEQSLRERDELDGEEVPEAEPEGEAA